MSSQRGLRKSLSPRGLKKLLEHDHAARIRSGVLIGRLKGKRDPVSSSPPLLSPRGFRYSSRCFSPRLTRLKKYFLFQTTTSRHNDFPPPPALPFFLNVDSFQSFSLFVLDREKAREREISRDEWREGGRERDINHHHVTGEENRRIRNSVRKQGWPAVGRVFDAAFRGESSPRWQCVGNCCSRNAAPGAKKNRSWPDALLFFSSFFFFFSPPPIISILTQSFIVTDIVTNYLSSSCPRDRGAVPPPKSLIEDSEKKRERDIYIILRF